MYILPNNINFTVGDARNDSIPIVFVHSSLSRSSSHSSSIVLILILTILCFFGVIFMIFGPIMRSEAMNRVDNLIFGRNSENENRPIDDVEHCDD
jgi:hypothetical protein